MADHNHIELPPGVVLPGGEALSSVSQSTEEQVVEIEMNEAEGELAKVLNALNGATQERQGETIGVQVERVLGAGIREDFAASVIGSAMFGVFMQYARDQTHPILACLGVFLEGVELGKELTLRARPPARVDAHGDGCLGGCGEIEHEAKLQS